MSLGVENPKNLNILGASEDTEVTVAVASTGTARSKHFLMPRGVSFAWEFQFSSDGAVDVKVELEQSDEEPADPDTPAADTQYVIPDGKVSNPISSGITDELRHRIAYSPVVSSFARLKFTGQGSNHASVICTRARMIYIKNT
jgi:hypothetical protein